MNIAYRFIKALDKILDIILYLVLIIVFLFCLYALFDTIKIYARASSPSISSLRPKDDDPQKSLNSLKAINKDVCGWITINDTKIDYPILRGKTNSDYLNKDVYGNYSLSGSIFLDYRADPNFKDLYSVIFGHHMDGGAMFGDLHKFTRKDYFATHKTGKLYTNDGIYNLEVIAYMYTDAYDSFVFKINNKDKEYQKKLEENIKRSSIYYNDDVIIDENTRIIGLSTCSTATTNGRDIVYVKIIEN